MGKKIKAKKTFSSGKSGEIYIIHVETKIVGNGNMYCCVISKANSIYRTIRDFHEEDSDTPVLLSGILRSLMAVPSGSSVIIVTQNPYVELICKKSIRIHKDMKNYDIVKRINSRVQKMSSIDYLSFPTDMSRRVMISIKNESSDYQRVS